MLLWLAFAVMTAAVLAAVLAPLARPPRPEEDNAAADGGALAVYRHQLGELEAERARGLVEESEADAARVEISRRLLAGAADAEQAARSQPTRQSRSAPLALATAILVPLLTLALYLTHGAPGLPSFPLSARKQVPVEQAEIADIVARVEARLRTHPDEVEGWDAIAPVYFKLGRFRDAANAFARASRLQGETVMRLFGFAEASILAADGIVGEEARLALEKILKLEPGRVEARFFLTLAKQQDGRLTEALEEYRTLLTETPPQHGPLRAAIARQIEEVRARLAAAEKGAPLGPTAADMAAAAKLTPEQRAQMIAAMVDGLAVRLERNGKDLAGWLQLVNAYAVLGRKDDARNALAEARRNFGGDDKALAELAVLAVSLGLGS